MAQTEIEDPALQAGGNAMAQSRLMLAAFPQSPGALTTADLAAQRGVSLPRTKLVFHDPRAHRRSGADAAPRLSDAARSRIITLADRLRGGGVLDQPLLWTRRALPPASDQDSRTSSAGSLI